MYGIWDESGFVGATDVLAGSAVVRRVDGLSFATDWTATVSPLVSTHHLPRYTHRLANDQVVSAYTDSTDTFIRLMNTAHAIAQAFAPPGWHPTCPRFSPTPIPEDGRPLFGVDRGGGRLSGFRFSGSTEYNLWRGTLRRDEDD